MAHDVNADTLDPAMGTATTSDSLHGQLSQLVLLTRLAREVFRRCTDDVLGMRMKQYALLCDLRDNGGAVPQQALCGAMHIDPNYLVLLLNESEDAGFVERRRDPEDRRRHIVELTPAGRRALERAEVGMQKVEDEVLSGLSEKERVQLGGLLSRAMTSADAAA